MKKSVVSAFAVILALLVPTMMLGGVFGLTGGTIQYIEWILGTLGNVSLVVSIVASLGAGASIGGVIYSLMKKKGIKWVAAW